MFIEIIIDINWLYIVLYVNIYEGIYNIWIVLLLLFEK